MVKQEILKLRAFYLKHLRYFLDRRGLLEVETPQSYRYPVTDPYIDCFQLTISGRKVKYLQSSPEYAMKRLLAHGSGSIYQIAKVFRAEPPSRCHHHEFTMAEWYYIDYDLFDLIDEMVHLFKYLKPDIWVQYFNYAELFEHHLNLNPHQASLDSLQAVIDAKIGDIQGLLNPDREECLNLLFSHVIEPQLDPDQLTIIYHYPACMAALAETGLDEQSNYVAKRVEIYYQKLELANGYEELTDYHKHIKRLQSDLAKRAKHGKAQVPVDQSLLTDLKNGLLPRCSGIAMGFDRLIMAMAGYKDINQVICNE